MKNKAWFRMEKKTEELAEIEIFDEIDAYFGFGPKEFKEQFDAIKSAKKIKVLLNSPGGSVFDGMTIYTLIAAEREKVEIEVLGLAASISSIVALAGSRLTVAKGAYYMIHNPWTFAMGGAEDLRKTADILDKLKGEFVSIYREKSGLKDEEIIKMMDAETWMTSEEAMANGFADDEEDYGQVAAKASAFSLTRYGFAHVPDPLAKSADVKRVSNPRELETLLRDSGMSRSEAVAIVANGWKALGQGEPVAEPQGEPVKKFFITPAMLIDEMEANARL
jgi:ATP-dependent Clp endopeptidase proteolytic subunit ClpP